MRLRFDFKKQILKGLYFNLDDFLVYAFQYHVLIFSSIFLFSKQDNLKVQIPKRRDGFAKIYTMFAKHKSNFFVQF